MNDHHNSALLLIIFGISGNLARRKLMPALYQLLKRGDLPERFRVVGISRKDYQLDKLFSDIERYLPEDLDRTVLDRLHESTVITQLDLKDRNAYKELLDHLQVASEELGGDTARLYYLSIPAQAFGAVVKDLGETGHNRPFQNEAAPPRLLVEKPFGYDTASARELIAAADEHYGEKQIYRIDHYLAKETAQNILTFRFNNPLFQTIWNARHIDHIKIGAYETIGIEGRADFYEKTGALRDILQSHLLQLLALIMMEQPAKLESSDIHRAKLRLLDSILPIEAEDVEKMATRGQYEGYRFEVDNPTSCVETFARLRLSVDNEQWRGVPVTLETGKALDRKCTEIAVHFRENHDAVGDNTLTFRLQPSEGITLSLQAKRPGMTNATDTVAMEFDYARSFASGTAEAYERVILDAVRGDQSLFASGLEVMASWEIVENVMTEWSKSDANLTIYSVGENPDKL